MFTYVRKIILLYAKSSNVDVYTVYGKYSQKDASEYTLVLCSALIYFFFWMNVKIFEIFTDRLPCSLCGWLWFFLGFFFFFIPFCKLPQNYQFYELTFFNRT